MKVTKIAAIAVGVVVIAAAIFAAYGIPARGLIESHAGEALAKEGVKLDIAGETHSLDRPPASPSNSFACVTPLAVAILSPSSACRPASR